MSLQRARVYVVRIWQEPAPAGQGAYRALVTDAVTRERHYFDSWNALRAFLRAEGTGGDAPGPRGRPGKSAKDETGRG